MARSRNIKPGFYLNEELAACSLLARFAFPGLWMQADRAGRMEDRPLRLKAAILPYDNADMDAILAELHTAGFIVRYESGGLKYLQIINFEKHQNPHIKEPTSVIPGPVGFGCGCKPDMAPDGPGARTGLAPGGHGSGPADSLLPLTDSLLPLSPPSGGVGGGNVGGEGSGGKPAKPKRGQKPRERNPLFDALVEVTGLDPATARGEIGAKAAQMAKASPPYTPEEVHEFARRFWEICPYAQRDGRTRPNPGEVAKYIARLRSGPGSPVPRPAASGRPDRAAELLCQARDAINAAAQPDQPGPEALE